MATAEDKVFKKHEAQPPQPSTTVPQIVSMYIGPVMDDRTKMKDMENALDAYLHEHYNGLDVNAKAARKDLIRKQLTDGRLALEAILQRFLVS